MRIWHMMIAALAFLALSASAVAAQSPIDCSAAPLSVCADKDLLELESERAALIGRIRAADAQHPVLSNEQTWIDGLGACGEDIACYRTAYLNHNQTLREAVAALPAQAEALIELPEAAPTVEEQTSELDALQAERLREAPEGGQTYVEPGLPGWGFFTAIGVTLLMFWMLMRAHGRLRRELRAYESRPGR